MKIDFSKHWKLALVIVLIIGAVFYLEIQKSTPSVESSESSQNLQEQMIDDSMQEKDLNNTTEEKVIPVRTRIPEKDALYTFAPEFTGIHNWIGTEPLTLAELKGKVVLIDFWTYSCINCIRTFPYITAWDEKYSDKGLVIIGVHTPEFFFEEKTENVVAAMEKYGIEFAVAQDNDKGTWRAYKNRYWPRKYLLDKDGYIRYDHIGEGAYDETEKKIQELLAEIGSDTSDELVDIKSEFKNKNTPELYAGNKFALRKNQNIGNEVGLQVDKEYEYALPSQFEYDKIYVEGTWKSNGDDLQAISNGVIVLNYVAKSVNIVAASDEVSAMKILVDNEFLNETSIGEDAVLIDGESIVNINEPRLYNVYSGEYDRKILRLEVENGFSFNSFTFG